MVEHGRGGKSMVEYDRVDRSIIGYDRVGKRMVEGECMHCQRQARQLAQ